MTTAWCKYCRFRIRWYPRWGAWGTPTGGYEYALWCKGTDRHMGHEPVDKKPGGD